MLTEAGIVVLSEGDKNEAREIAVSVKRGVGFALDVAYGNTPRPQKRLRESMLELQREIAEEEAVHG